MPTWLYHEINRYRAGEHGESRPQPNLIASALGDIETLLISKQSLTIETRSQFRLTISGNAEIVVDGDAYSLWPHPQTWFTIERLLGDRIDYIRREDRGAIAIQLSNNRQIRAPRNGFELALPPA